MKPTINHFSFLVNLLSSEIGGVGRGEAEFSEMGVTMACKSDSLVSLRSNSFALSGIMSHKSGIVRQVRELGERKRTWV